MDHTKPLHYGERSPSTGRTVATNQWTVQLEASSSSSSDCQVKVVNLEVGEFLTKQIFIATITTEGYSTGLASPTPEHRGGFIGDDTQSPCTNSRCPTRRTSKRKRTESLTNYCKACAPKYVPSAPWRIFAWREDEMAQSRLQQFISLPYSFALAFSRFHQVCPTDAWARKKKRVAHHMNRRSSRTEQRQGRMLN